MRTFILPLLALLTSCQPEVAPRSVNNRQAAGAENPRLATLLTAGTPLPDCNDKIDGRLIYSVDDKSFHACTSGTWQVLDLTQSIDRDALKGDPGPAGAQGPKGDAGDGAWSAAVGGVTHLLDKVAIGTTTPTDGYQMEVDSAPLSGDVTFAANFRNSAARALNNAVQINLGDGGGWTAGIRGTVIDGATGASSLSLFTNDGSTGLVDYMQINAAGNARIGTGLYDNQYRFHIIGQGATQSSLRIAQDPGPDAVTWHRILGFTNEAYTVQYATLNASSDTLWFLTATKALRLGTIEQDLRLTVGPFASQIEAIHIAGLTGKVGINTTSPTRELSVAGTLDIGNHDDTLISRVDTATLRISTASPGPGAIPLYIRADNNGVAQTDGPSIITGGGGSLDLEASPSSVGQIYLNNASTKNVIMVNGGGKVGIGTVTPQATLDINGTARLARNTAEPYTCDATHDGALAMTGTHRLCACDGTAWVFTTDGTTACAWQ